MKRAGRSPALVLVLCAALALPAAIPALAGSGTASFESRTLAVEAPVLKSFLQDLDQDGLPDFAFLAEDRRFVLFFQEDGARFRREEASCTIPEGCGSIDLADVDGDGVPDICFTVDGRRLVMIRSAGRRQFWHELAAAGKVDGFEALEKALDGSGAGCEPLLAMPLTDSLHRSPDLMWDLDGDGRQDLIYPRFMGLDVHFNRAGKDGSAGAPFSTPYRQFLTRGPQVSLRGNRVRVSRELPQPTDLDGDGLPEMLFEPRPLNGMGQLECDWYRFSPDNGMLQQEVQQLQFGLGESVTDYLLDDLNGDGTPDLAALSTSFNMDDPAGGKGTVSSGGGSFFEEKELRVWLSTGPGAPMGRQPSGQWTSQINIWQEALIRHTDLTGDGTADLCIFYYKGLINAKLVVDIYPGQGKGLFGERVKGQKISFDSARRESIFPDSDMDGDGLDDLVLLADSKVRIHLRNPAGSKDPFSSKPWAVLDQRPGTEEQDEDGETVTMRLGSTGSDISFSSNQLGGLRIVDLNNDGRQDLVLVNRPDDWDQEDLGRPPVTLLLHLAR